MTAPLDPSLQPPPRGGALALSTYQLTKRFGAFTALDHVDLEVRPGTVHALLGENGAGKSTLVKAIVGYHQPDEGAVLIDGREQAITSPVVARELGIGMVYQHFTVVPGMTVAENLLLAKGALPAVLPWKRVRAELDAFLATTPFKLDLDARPVDLSAGEKQKLEILKQLYLRPRLLILDEPTSVLTPQEADEVLGALRERAHAGEVSVIMISHKFREVMEVADDVSVLRRGKLMGSHRVAETTPRLLGAEMMGQSAEADPASPQASSALQATLARAPMPQVIPRLRVSQLRVDGDRGEEAVRGLTVTVHAGEIVGVAGVSGNGQRELLAGKTRNETAAADFAASFQTTVNAQQIPPRRQPIGLPRQDLPENHAVPVQKCARDVLHGFGFRGNVPFRVDVGVKFAARGDVVEQLDTADFDDAMIRGVEPRCFRIHYDFAHSPNP